VPDGELGGTEDGGTDGDAGGDEGGVAEGEVVLGSWVKNVQISPDVQVRASLGLAEPSTGLGV
jgi:hypothetical protein